MYLKALSVHLASTANSWPPSTSPGVGPPRQLVEGVSHHCPQGHTDPRFHTNEAPQSKRQRIGSMMVNGGTLLNPGTLFSSKPSSQSTSSGVKMAVILASFWPEACATPKNVALSLKILKTIWIVLDHCTEFTECELLSTCHPVSNSLST